MSRVEKFKEMRQYRRKKLLIGALALALMTSGMSVADYALNGLISNQQQVNLVSMRNADGSYMEISVLNEKVYFDSSSITREFGNIREMGKRILGIQ